MNIKIKDSNLDMLLTNCYHEIQIWITCPKTFPIKRIVDYNTELKENKLKLYQDTLILLKKLSKPDVADGLKEDALKAIKKIEKRIENLKNKIKV